MPTTEQSEEEQKYARDISNELKDLVGGNVYCPRCNDPSDREQPLYQMSDWPETWFCPHCDLRVNLVVDLMEK